jgi:hypothetical protein
VRARLAKGERLFRGDAMLLAAADPSLIQQVLEAILEKDLDCEHGQSSCRAAIAEIAPVAFERLMCRAKEPRTTRNEVAELADLVLGLPQSSVPEARRDQVLADDAVHPLVRLAVLPTSETEETRTLTAVHAVLREMSRFPRFARGDGIAFQALWRLTNVEREWARMCVDRSLALRVRRSLVERDAFWEGRRGGDGAALTSSRLLKNAAEGIDAIPRGLTLARRCAEPIASKPRCCA